MSPVNARAYVSVLRKYLERNAALRERLWLCSRSAGGQGDRANLWLLINTTAPSTSE